MDTVMIEKIYETMLLIPGMNDNVRVRVELQRKDILLLGLLIEGGLHNDKSASLIRQFSKDKLDPLSKVPGDMLSRAGIADLAEKLKTFLPAP